MSGRSMMSTGAPAVSVPAGPPTATPRGHHDDAPEPGSNRPDTRPIITMSKTDLLEHFHFRHLLSPCRNTN
jgi:hypothetical protein